MNEELEDLKNLGAQKIYEDTHIPLEHIQALIHGSFEGFAKVQFLGFISILEREYAKELPLLKAAGLKYFNEIKTVEKETNLMAPKKGNKNKITIYFIVLLLIVGVYFYSSGILTNNEKIETPLVEKAITDNSEIEEETVTTTVTGDENSTQLQEKTMQENSVEAIAETNATEFLEVTNENSAVEEMQEAVELEKSFKIKSSKKVWFGYINIKTNKKNQKIFKGEFDLDPNEDWLLLFGHSFIDIYVDGEKQSFNSTGNKRFSYRDGELKAISIKMFKRLNRGRKW
ncbi:hypothetical protein GJV85_11765 [Sulfurimonas aquatica]|uniref:Helix-turn-helix domain-containing protein n=1 Tax=Sulfurimonas aquatica TaxID=2672570 RepID=A0A975B1Z4_9BACT|nr:hypothetical protein [Sulfurimonas aquatica]QSZ42761.1 hypothetical protein GJV85_11765 [Sulfurimonas aquatica]